MLKKRAASKPTWLTQARRTRPHLPGLNSVDRFQALIRHPDYRNDPRLAGALKIEASGFDLRSEIGLAALVTQHIPPDERCNQEWWKGLCVYVAWLEHWGLRHGVDYKNAEAVRTELAALRAGDDSIFEDDLRGYVGNNDRYTDEPAYRYNLSVSVDLQRPTEELVVLIRTMIDTEKKKREIPAKRTRPHKLDPWQVWDEKHVHNKNFSKIARDHFKVDGGNTADDSAMHAALNKVKLAYSKAKALIAAMPKRNMMVRKSVNMPQALKDYLARRIEVPLVTIEPRPSTFNTSDDEFAETMARLFSLRSTT